MHGIAKRIEDCADIVGNLVRQRDHVEGRKAQVLGKSALLVNTDTTGCRIKMKFSRATLPGGLAN